MTGIPLRDVFYDGFVAFIPKRAVKVWWSADAELVRDRQHVVGEPGLHAGHRPRAVGTPIDRAEQHGDVEAVILVQARDELVAGGLLRDAERDVRGHAEGVPGVVLVVVRGVHLVLGHARRRLAEVEDRVLVVARRGLGASAVVTTVDDVELGRGDPRVALAVLAEVGTVPVAVGPTDRLERAAVVADDPQIEVDRVGGVSLIPAQTGRERLARQLLGVALLHLQLNAHVSCCSFRDLSMCTDVQKETIDYIYIYVNIVLKSIVF